MILAISTSLSILILIFSLYMEIPANYLILAKSIIFLTAAYRIYNYIVVQHWEWVLPFFLLILYINPFYTFPIAEMSNGYVINLILKVSSIFLLGYSYKHIG
jgi:hypothetical protein